MTKPKTKPKAATRSTARKTAKPASRKRSTPASPRSAAEPDHAYCDANFSRDERMAGDGPATAALRSIYESSGADTAQAAMIHRVLKAKREAFSTAC